MSQRLDSVATSSDTDNEFSQSRPRRPRKPAFNYKPTRRQLRSAAPDGLLIEDILRRIEFDEALPEDHFVALVDPVDHTESGRPETPRGAKWCRRFCWTGSCTFSDQCWYSHGGMSLIPWGLADEERLTVAPGSNKSPLSPMVRLRLDEISRDDDTVYRICFLLFNERVVWGRDIGAWGADLWTKFVKRRRLSEDNFEEPNAHKMTANWTDLPCDILARVVRALSVEDLVGCLLSFGHSVDWASVSDERWPAEMTPWSVIDSSRMAAIFQVAALVEASRLAAQVLHGRAAMHVSGQSPCTSPVPRPLPAPIGSVFVCSATSEWISSMPAPACIRFDSEVCSFCFDASLMLSLTMGGGIWAIRRDDLKRISSVKVRSASCLDFYSETLLVGTRAPAHIFAYDLSVATPKVKHKLCISGDDATVAAVSIFFTSETTCVCCVFSSGDRMEVLLIGCHDKLTILHRLPSAKALLCGQLCFTCDCDGQLCIWDTSEKSFKASVKLPKSETSWMHGCLRGGSESRHIAAAHTFEPGLMHKRVHAYNVCNGDASYLLESSAKLSVDDPVFKKSESMVEHDWMVLDMHIEGDLLIVLTDRIAFDSTLELPPADHSGDDPFFQARTQPGPAPGPRLFAWHLPSGRPIVSDGSAPAITAFGHPKTGSCGLIAFAASSDSATRNEGFATRSNHCILMPTAGSVRRASRRQSHTGPVRRAVAGSDVRARGMHKQGRNKR